MFIEVARPPKDIEQFYQAATSKGEYLPKRNTIWPKENLFHIAFTADTLNGLATLARNHAEPEIASHLFVYEDAQALLEYPDAFGTNSPILISAAADSVRVTEFANILALIIEPPKA